MEEQINYNDEPVFYCERCLSLNVKKVPSLEDSDYCDDCTSTCIRETTIEEWEKLYIEKYKHPFLEKY